MSESETFTPRCVGCGSILVPPKRLYCSRLCNRRVWTENHREAVRARLSARNTGRRGRSTENDRARSRRWRVAYPEKNHDSQRRWVEGKLTENPYWNRDRQRDLKRRRLKEAS